jgi:hypothetical protein
MGVVTESSSIIVMIEGVQYSRSHKISLKVTGKFVNSTCSVRHLQFHESKVGSFQIPAFVDALCLHHGF